MLDQFDGLDDYEPIAPPPWLQDALVFKSGSANRLVDQYMLCAHVALKWAAGSREWVREWELIFGSGEWE